MKTELINPSTGFQPVTLSMTFETEDELAVFLSVLGGAGISTFNPLDSDSEFCALSIVDDLIPYALWSELRDTVRDSKFTV